MIGAVFHNGRLSIPKMEFLVHLIARGIQSTVGVDRSFRLLQRRVVYADFGRTRYDLANSKQLRFTLAELLWLTAAIPISVGVVAAIEFAAFIQSYEWFGIDWHSYVRDYLTSNIGMSPHFVARYITFAMHDVSAWVCYAFIALLLGLVRSKWAYIGGVAFVASILAWDFMSDYFSGMHHLIYLRLVSLFGVIVAGLFFLFARRIRGRKPASERKPGRIALGFTYLVLIAIFATSAFGWWFIDEDRKAGLEVQKIFNIDPDTSTFRQ